jgi:large subunit ribosomal protein L10
LEKSEKIMPTPHKAQVIDQAEDWYSRSQGIVFTDYRGLTVKEFQNLRKQLRAKGGEIHVVKNTLFRRAAGDDIEKIPAEYHNGTTAVAFLFENESEGSKVIADFATSSKKLIIKGGFYGGKVFDAKGVEKISKLPSKDVLIAQVIGTIVAPITQLVGTIESIYATPIRTIFAVADKANEGVPQAAAPEVVAETPAAVVEAEVPAEAEAAAEAPVEAEAAVEAEATSEATSEAPASEEAPATEEPEATEETPSEITPEETPAADEAAPEN